MGAATTTIITMTMTTSTTRSCRQSLHCCSCRASNTRNSNSSNNTAPAVTTTAKPTTQPGGIVLTLEQMANVKVAGIDNTKKETYLSDADFQKHFKMSRADFYKQPVWKQNDQKKKLGIF
eukprot:GEZU01017023.1.p2 GENE.GEZU01017023.1~~GEZU01017023.1.p2  ORF type:complete len:120 (+),score=36.20 GEZU01017023.1:515-874(+)